MKKSSNYKLAWLGGVGLAIALTFILLKANKQFYPLFSWF